MGPRAKTHDPDMHLQAPLTPWVSTKRNPRCGRRLHMTHQATGAAVATAGTPAAAACGALQRRARDPATPPPREGGARGREPRVVPPRRPTPGTIGSLDAGRRRPPIPPRDAGQSGARRGRGGGTIPPRLASGHPPLLQRRAAAGAVSLGQGARQGKPCGSQGAYAAREGMRLLALPRSHEPGGGAHPLRSRPKTTSMGPEQGSDPY